MFKRAIAFSVLLSGLLTAPSFAQSMIFDPSGTIPFQEQAIDPQQANGSNSLQFGAQQITGIYYNQNDQSRAHTVNGLPPTSLDSFVYEAGGMAELIYGDEGTTDIPPYFGFDESHRINLGITGTRAQGLTTGHGQVLPNAWGGDEFTGPEFSMAGSPMPTAPGTLNILGGQVRLPNVNIPGMPGGVQTLFGGSNGIGGTNSQFP